MEQRERISSNLLSKPASVPPDSKNLLAFPRFRVVSPNETFLYPPLPPVFPLFVPLSFPRLPHLFDLSSHPVIAATLFAHRSFPRRTHTSSCSLLTKYSRDCQRMGEIAKWMFVPDGENSFRVSLCYFYEHLANPYPLLSFDFSIFIFPSFRVLYFDGFILIDHIF